MHHCSQAEPPRQQPAMKIRSRGATKREAAGTRSAQKEKWREVEGEKDCRDMSECLQQEGETLQRGRGRLYVQH